MPQYFGTDFRGDVRIEDGSLVIKDGGPLGPSVTYGFAQVRVTSAEILALFATPKTLVPAPGAGKLLEFLGGSIALDATATAYAGVAAGEDLTIKYTNAAGVIVSTTLETTGFIDQTTDQVRTFKPIVTDLIPAVNAALVLHLLVGEIITGTGTLIVNVRYAIHETGL